MTNVSSLLPAVYRLKMKDGTSFDLDREIFDDYLLRVNEQLESDKVRRLVQINDCLKYYDLGIAVDWSMEAM